MLIYCLQTQTVYEDFYENENLSDFSDYPQDSNFYYSAKKEVIGKMKDEFRGKIINEFAGLKPKMYSLIAVDGREIKKAKGVNTNVKNISQKEYINVLFNKK